MALEKTVLNEKIASALLAQHYGITLVSMQKLELGSANCFRVSDGGKDYFLKEYQSDFTKESIEREAKLLEFLSSKDIPVARFYKTADDEYVICAENHLLCLEEYVDGQSYGYDDLPPRLLPQVGQMLGRLHRALKDYPLPTDMDRAWFASFSAEKMIADYDALIEIAAGKADDPNAAGIIDDLQYKKQLAHRCEDYKKYYSGVTYCATHGDYQGCQLIFDQDQIKAVVDFSSAACLPVVWEVMRSFVQSSSTCITTAAVDVDALCDYVREYQKFSPLTQTDLHAMPYVYLFQLARSKFGYPQYLKTDSEDRESLLQFAHWRTKMCREVEKNAEMIANRLVKLLP